MKELTAKPKIVGRELPKLELVPKIVESGDEELFEKYFDLSFAEMAGHYFDALDEWPILVNGPAGQLPSEVKQDDRCYELAFAAAQLADAAVTVIQERRARKQNEDVGSQLSKKLDLE